MAKAPAKKLGNVGTHFVFENEHVKVWNLILEPGESSPWHHHTMNYLFVVTEPGTLRAEYDDGTSAEHTYQRGQVVMGQKDSVHRVTNIGSSRWSNAIIELRH
jgi:quercetin dioxygenase-like cupin family protein